MNNQKVVTHLFNYYMDGNDCLTRVVNALGCATSYLWNNKTKRIEGIETLEGEKLILREQFRWGDDSTDRSHLTAKIFEDGNGTLITFQEYQYDSYGNILSQILYGNLSGDKKNLIKIDPSLKAPSHDSCDVYKVNYQYDDKQRKISEEDCRVTHKYTYDGLNRRIARVSDEGATYFLWQKQQEIGAISPEGKISELQILGPNLRGVAFEFNGSLYIPIYDSLGNVRALLDDSGNIQATYRYSRLLSKLHSIVKMALFVIFLD